MDELNEHIRGIAFVDEDVKEEGVPLPIHEEDILPEKFEEGEKDFLRKKFNVDEKHIYPWETREDAYLRVEALKLAYDTAHKIGGFSQMSTYMAHDSKALLEDDVRDVFKLADMNYQYIKGRS